MTKEELYDLYIIQNKTALEIAKIFNTTKNSIKYKLKKYNIYREKTPNPAKAEIEHVYIELNYTRAEAAEKLGISEHLMRDLITEYGIKKDKTNIYKNIQKTFEARYGVSSVGKDPTCREKQKEVMLKKYGVDNSMKLKETREKAQQTLMEHYGVSNAMKSEEIKNKAKQTIIERYGVEHPSQNQEIKNKAIQASITKYGVPYPAMSTEVRNKIKKTLLERYGVDDNLKIPEVRAQIIQTKISKYNTAGIKFTNEIRNKISNTCQEKYGIPWFCMKNDCRSAVGSKSSNTKPNLNFAKKLDDNNISYEREFAINNRLYDFKINSTFIEINPTATHNSTWGLFTKSGIAHDYHFNKSKLALENSYHCIHVFDWDDEEKIINLISPKTVIYARNCELRDVPVSDANKFLTENHLQGKCYNQKILLGLYYNNELVELMTFGKPRYNKHYQYELLRLCTKSGITVIGGASKLFKKFITEYSPESIISYCDNAKFSGEIYKTLGFELKSYGSPTCHWYNMKTKQHITDNLLRQRGFDQLFKTNFGKGISNSELMINHGFVEVYDCGQSVWIYKK